MMMMEGDDQDVLKTTAANATVDQTESIATAIPSGNDVEDQCND
jgi:hypothetical protein